MYTFSLKWRINDVPITCYLATHAYFIFYHSLTNLILRRLRRALAALPSAASVTITCLVILVLAYVTAFMETFTIANFPYYEFKDRDYAYTIGSAFYAIYFIVSFPMFLRIDEHPGSSRCACAASQSKNITDAAAANGLFLALQSTRSRRPCLSPFYWTPGGW